MGDTSVCVDLLFQEISVSLNFNFVLIIKIFKITMNYTEFYCFMKHIVILSKDTVTLHSKGIFVDVTCFRNVNITLCLAGVCDHVVITT